jgi:hypothetical protein
MNWSLPCIDHCRAPVPIPDHPAPTISKWGSGQRPRKKNCACMTVGIFKRKKLIDFLEKMFGFSEKPSVFSKILLRNLNI